MPYRLTTLICLLYVQIMCPSLPLCLQNTEQKHSYYDNGVQLGMGCTFPLIHTGHSFALFLRLLESEKVTRYVFPSSYCVVCCHVKHSCRVCNFVLEDACTLLIKQQTSSVAVMTDCFDGMKICSECDISQ